MIPAYPQIRDLVLIGGGHAHALVLRMWGMNPLAGTRITVINPDPVAPYTGMLPGLIAGHYRRDELMIDLVRLARFAGARVILDRATGIDRAARLVHLAGRPPLAYDLAAIDVGITSDLPAMSGAAEHAVAAKPLGRYAEAWETFLAAPPARPRLVILGAGLGGVELALASAHRLRGLGASVTLLDRAEAFLPLLGTSARRVLEQRLAAAGVSLRLGVQVASVGPLSVMMADGEEIGADFTLTATGARPHGWLAETGLRQEDGFLLTDATLRTSDPLIFASGDCAGIEGDPRPKAGVFAVRAARVLHANLRAALMGKPSAGVPAPGGLPEADLAGRTGGGGREMGAGRVRSALLAAEGPDRPQVHGEVRGLSGDGCPRGFRCRRPKGWRHIWPGGPFAAAAGRSWGRRCCRRRYRSCLRRFGPRCARVRGTMRPCWLWAQASRC
jgi:selenide,water dikinase